MLKVFGAPKHNNFNRNNEIMFLFNCINKNNNDENHKKISGEHRSL